MPIFGLNEKNGNVCIKISIIMLIFVYLVCIQYIRRILVHIFWSTYMYINT